jgi:hypothetical protein
MKRPEDDREDRAEEPGPGGRAARRRRQFERSRGLTEGGELDLEPLEEDSEKERERPEEEQP